MYEYLFLLNKLKSEWNTFNNTVKFLYHRKEDPRKVCRFYKKKSMAGRLPNKV